MVTMRNRKRLTILAGVFIIALTAFFSISFAPSAAQASDDEAELTELILDQLDRNDDIAVIEPAKLSNLELLKEKSFGSHTTIVTVSPSALDSHAPDELSRFIVNEDGNGYETSLNLLVVTHKNGDEIYVSAADEKLEQGVVELLGGESVSDPIHSDDAGWDILRNSDSIYKLQRDISPSVSWMIVFIFPGIFVYAIVIMWLVHLLNKHAFSYAAKRKRSTKKANRVAARKKRENDVATAKAAKLRKLEKEKLQRERELNQAEIPTLLEQHITDLRQYADGLKNEDPELADAVELTLERFGDLREALTLMEATEAKRGVLFVEYENQFEKLVTLLGPKYYLDIKKNPIHWRKPEDKLSSIRLSFVITAQHILDSIVRLKEGSEFDFQLSIESILKFKVVSPRDLLG